MRQQFFSLILIINYLLRYAAEAFLSKRKVQVEQNPILEAEKKLSLKAEIANQNKIR